MLSCLRILSAAHRVIPWKFLPESLGNFLQTATKVNQLSKTAKKHMAKFKLKDNKTNNSTCKQSKGKKNARKYFYIYYICITGHPVATFHHGPWPTPRSGSPQLFTSSRRTRVAGSAWLVLICCVFGNQYNDLVLAKGSEPPRNPKAATVLSWCLRSWQHLLQP